MQIWAVLWICITLIFDGDPDSTYHPDADPDKDPDPIFTLMRIRIQILASK